LAGFEDALAYINATGGICGATLASEYRDTGGNTESAQAAWDDLTSRRDAVLMFLYLTDDAELLREQAERQQIPIVVSSGSVEALYGENGDDPGWVFSVTPINSGQLAAFCDYISQEWDSFGIAGAPVIGHVSFLGAYGESSDTPEARAYCQSKGVGYAGARYYFPGIPDISSLIQGVIADGANILYTTSVATGAPQLAATVASLGLEGQVLLAGPNIVLDTATIQLGGESVVGLVGQLPYLWWDEAEHPGIQTLTQYWLENRLPRYSNPQEGLATRNVAYLIAWAAVDLYAQLLTVTINRVGFENLDGAAMFQTMTSGLAYSALDGVATVQYGPDVREFRLTRLGSIQGVETSQGQTLQILPLTDFVPVPDVRPNGADVP
jgi:ABC-type branched-subunit amino acid transport system substrate-binding protein